MRLSRRVLHCNLDVYDYSLSILFKYKKLSYSINKYVKICTKIQ